MKILLISWMLLALGVSLNSGHYIYKVEKENAPAYEVKSNLKGAVIVNSRFEKPTLKDILYHDLIHRYFSKEEPLITERAFTNSHGLPFLEELDKEYMTQNDELEGRDDDLFEEAEPKPLTDEAVKEAYRTRSSYLFDQMRQRSDVISPDLLERKKRQAEKPFLPEPPRLSSDNSYQAPFVPNTYGMNLNPGGGYMWNNLNKPSLFEVGQPFNGYENAFPNPPQPTPAPDSDSDSSEDIYVNIKRPSAEPLEKELTDNTENEAVSENPAPSEPRELTDVPTEPNQGSEPAKATEIPEPAPVIENAEPVLIESDEPKEAIEATEANEAREATTEETVLRDAVPVTEVPSESSVVPDEGRNFGEAAVIPEEDKVKEIPEAPTLPPLNYDNLPDDVRQAISSTERILTSEEQELEDILATAQPVGDIPKTYGMNLTSGGGKVWNDLVNPPVSYEVGSTESSQPEEAKETTQSPAIIEEPTTAAEPIEPANPEEPEKAKEPANPEVIAPIEPANPEEPEKDKEPSNPEVIAPIEPANPEEPENKEPSNPEVIAPIEPANPEEPEKDKEPSNPEVIAPIEPVNPEEPENKEPSNPEVIAPIEPANPEEPADKEPAIPEVTEPAITTNEPNVPENEIADEKTTELPDTTSTVGISDIAETEANEENNTTTELPAIIENTGTETIESITEETTNSDLPDISTTESAVEDVTNGDVESVEPVTAAGDLENPEEPEAGSGEIGDEEEPEEKPDIMSELLKSEQFWQWLGEWMASYTELMEKHIRRIAVEEICKSRQGDICPLNKPEDSGSIIKDGKVTIDGKDVSLNQLKRGNKGNSVDATTIYGNSVGNEKVTNVFIFNSDNAKDILEGLKPENDTKVNIIVENKEEGRGNSENIDIAAVNTEVPELEATTTEITELSGIEDRGDGKAEVPKVEDVETKEQVISENKEAADAKEVEKVTEELKDGDATTEIADVREVKPDLSESGIENTTEAKLDI